MLLKTLEQDKNHFVDISRSNTASDHDKYVTFSRFMQDLFIPQGGYLIENNNFEITNAALLVMIMNRIKKHPIIWKLFFNHY
jgi:hypothetical protein